MNQLALAGAAGEWKMDCYLFDLKAWRAAGLPCAQVAEGDF